MKKVLVFLIIVAANLAVIGQVLALDNSYNSDVWRTEYAAVSTITNAGDKVYIGGSFRYFGPKDKMVAYNVDTTAKVSSSIVFNNDIYDIVSDGSGGWYVVGSFTQIQGETRNRAAHLLSDYSLDSDWNPNLNGTGDVVLVSSDGSTIYIGGTFTTVNGGTSRNRIAAFNNSTGTVDSNWNPNAGNYVYALATDNSYIYAGGYFTSIGGQSRNRLAALETAGGGRTGQADTSWNPDITWVGGSIGYYGPENLTIYSSTIYVGGRFNRANGGTLTRYCAAAFELAGSGRTGTATAWDPNPNNMVSALLIDGSNIYLGGNYTSINGSTSRNRLARANLTDGTVDSWNPDANNVGGGVYSLAKNSDGSKIYAGGGFNTIGGNFRYGIAEIEATTGSVTSWGLAAGNPAWSGGVFAVEVNNNVLVYAELVSAGGKYRERLARVSADGSVDDWAPTANSTVRAITVSGNTAYIAGSFTTVNGTTRNRLAAVDTTTGVLTDWNPNVNGTVYTLQIVGSTVYFGGYFSTVNGSVTRNNLAAVDASTGTVTDWDPNVDVDGSVAALVISDSIAYVGGYFFVVNGSVTRNHLAAFDLSTGTVTAWDPDPDDSISAMSVSGSTVYAGGYFTTVNGGAANRYHLAAFDTTLGTVTDWDPDPDGTIYAIKIGDSYIFVGGNFSNFGSTARENIGAFNKATGALDNWNPSDAPDDSISVIENTDETVWIGGAFYQLGSDIYPGFAQYGTMPTATPTPTPTPTPTTTSSGGSTSPGAGGGGGGGSLLPGKAPWLYGALIKCPSSIELYFTDAELPVDKYVIKYGLKPGEYIYGNQNIGGHGTRKYLVKYLQPGVDYFFRIRAGNGKDVGHWSNELSFRIPEPCEAVYYSSPTLTPPGSSSEILPFPTPTPSIEQEFEESIGSNLVALVPGLKSVLGEIAPPLSKLALALIIIKPILDYLSLGVLMTKNLAQLNLPLSRIVRQPLSAYISLLYSFGFLRRKKKTWGIIFDSITNRPLDQAMVIFYSPSGNLVTDFSNTAGRFGIANAPPDDYQIKVDKRGYSFPSRIVKITENNLFAHIYQPGEVISVKEGEPVANIALPMDPHALDRKVSIFRKLWIKFINFSHFVYSKYFYVFCITGILLAAYVYLNYPNRINCLTILLLVLIFLLNLVRDISNHRKYGKVLDRQTMKPLVNICLNLYRETKSSKQDLYSSTLTDSRGRYLLVPENGVYNLAAIIAGREIIIRKGIKVTNDQPSIRQTVELEGEPK